MPNDATLKIVAEYHDKTMKEIQKTAKSVNAFGKTVEKTNKRIAKSNKVVQGMSVQFKRLSHAMFSIRHVFGTVLGGMVVKSLANTASKAEDMHRAFENLTESAGIDTTKALKNLREATKGTVHDMDLMQTANNAMLLGVLKTEEDFYNLTNSARILGKAVGRTAVEAFNDLAIGIGRQSRLILDNLGVIVRAEEAYENYAKSVGKAVGELTQQEQREAFRVAALESVRKKVASLGEDTLSSSEKFAQFNVELKEAWATISKELQPALLELAKALGGVVKAVSPLVKLLAVSGAGFSVMAKAGDKLADALAPRYGPKNKLEPSAQWTEKDINDWLSMGLIPESEGQRLLELLTQAKRNRMRPWKREVLESWEKEHSFANRGWESYFTPLAVEDWTGEKPRGDTSASFGKLFGAIGQVYSGAMKRAEEEVQKYRKQKEEEAHQLRIQKAQELAQRRIEIESIVGRSALTRGELLGIGPEQMAAFYEQMEAQEQLISGWREYIRAVEEFKGVAVASFESATLAIEQYYQEIQSVSVAIGETVFSVMQSLENTISTVFFDAIMGKLKSAKEYLRSFLSDMARAISKFLAQQAVLKLLGLAAGALGGAVGGGGAGAATTSIKTSHGGVMRGYSPGLSGYQHGGLITRPTLALMGEGGPEMVTPWGKTPEASRSGQTVNVNITIPAMDGPSVKRVLHSERKYLQHIIQEALSIDPQFRATIRTT